MVIKEVEEDFEVITYLYGKEKDRQIGKTVGDIENNDWIDFTGEGALAANAGALLEGGANGSIEEGSYS